MGVARTFQNIRLFPQQSVLDNVMTGLNNQVQYSLAESLLHVGSYHKKEKEMTERSMEILRVFGLEDSAQTLASNLPYGKQRKLEIARALATKPELLLLDEPAAGMNPNETGELMDTIRLVRKEYQVTILLIEHDIAGMFWRCGSCGSEPWDAYEAAHDGKKVKFLCPVPGYDRHFGITADLGIENVPVAMTDNGPDMAEVERLVATDDSIKGIWCVPKYSNPTGITFSEDTVRRLVEMPTAAPDFRIFWDNAYCVHDLYDETDELANIFDLARAAGTEDRVVAFASTSKITFPGAGIGFIGASPAVIAEFSKRLKAGLISADKLNQLRHVRFLPTIEAVKKHMKKHAEFLRPRFEAVERKLTEGLGDTGCATWTHPRGGYFVSFDGPEGSAQKVAALCADLGVKLTPAGATWPYGKDPRDTNIRIAPSYPTVEDLEAALDVLVLAVKLVAAELARAERA